MSLKTPMNVHLFKVVKSQGARPLTEVLAELQLMSLEERLRSVGINDMRLELAERPAADQKYWKLDFCKLRTQGPGRAGRQEVTKSFALGEGERFSEETALVYDAETEFVSLQYNHYGPRAQAIADYLSIFVPQGESYSLLLQLDPTAQARLKSKKQFTRLVYKVAPAKLSDAWKRNNVSMYKAIEAQQTTYGGDWVCVEVALEQRSPTSLKLLDKIKGVIGLANEGDDAVRQLEIAGRDAAGENIDVVDLLTEKLVLSYKGLPQDEGFRVSAIDRWKCLEEAMRTWRSKGIVS